jgi:hypothetical protein
VIKIPPTTSGEEGILVLALVLIACGSQPDAWST